MTGDLWCERCDQPAAEEFRQPDGSTVALCERHIGEARWKAGNFNWDKAAQPLTTSQHRRETYRRMK